MHAFVARLPQTSQSCSAEAAGGAGGADSADEKSGAEADAEVGMAEDVAEFCGTVAAPDGTDEDEDVDADAAEVGVGEGGEGGGDTAEDVVEFDETILVTVPALDGFPPLFFVMVGCLGYRISRRARASATTLAGFTGFRRWRRRGIFNGIYHCITG